MSRVDVNPSLGAAGQRTAAQVLATAATSDMPMSLPSPKIRPWHLQRKAIVYIRQSTPQQVLEHRESADRQYGLVHRAAALGWPQDGVEVVDEDQGRSGQTVEGRLGFQYLLAEISLDHVGIIFGLEMSRLARSNKDWHQLLEVFNHPPTGYISCRPARSPWTPTSKCRACSACCSTSSSGKAASTASCTTWSSTTSAGRFGRTTAPTAVSSNGAAPTVSPCSICCITPFMRGTTAGATGRAIPGERWAAVLGRGGRSARPRSAWSCSKVAARPTSRPSATGPTSSVCRPTVPPV